MPYSDIYGDIYDADPPAVWPTFIIELGLTADPLDALATVTWTDITEWVLELDTFTGRTHELARSEPGEGTVRLNNRDRRFDPTNTASPYAPHLVPMRRIRIRAIWNLVTYAVWCGYVRTFQPRWPSVASSEVTLPVADALYALNLTPIANSAYHDAVLADTPIRYYRLAEAPGAAVAIDSASGANGYYSNGPELGVVGPLVTEDDTAASFAPSLKRLDCPGLPTVYTGGFAWECWVQSTAQDEWPAGSVPLGEEWKPGTALQGDGSTTAIAIHSLRGGGFLSATIGSIRLDTPQSITDGDWHHVVLSRNAAGTIYSLYVDGGLADSVTASLLSIPPLNFGIARAADHTGRWDGAIDEVAVYAHELTAARVLAHYNAAIGGMWASQLSGQRVGAVLDAIGWAAADRAIDTGGSHLPRPPEPLSHTMAFAHLDTVTDTEDGFLFVSPDGKVTFYDRYRPLFAPYTSSVATFGDGATEHHYDQGGIEVEPDEADLWTAVSVTRDGGVVQRIADDTARDAYGWRELQKSGLVLRNDNEAMDRARWDLAHYKDPTQRVRKIVLHPLGEADDLWPQALGRAILDRITAVARPVGGGPAFSQDVLIEGVHHHFVAGESWETEFSTAPAETTGPYWVLATAALDTDSRLAY